MNKTFLITGFGSIGKRHAEILQRFFTDSEIILYRHKKSNASGFKEFYSLREALKKKPFATFVTNPSSEHINTAILAAKSGSHVFIEKPISNNLKRLGELLDISKKKNLVIAIGYNMRFLESLSFIKKSIESGKIGKIISARIQVGQYLPSWRPSREYSSTYSAKSELGGGVLLDLSHEIDYARWFFGETEEVFAFADKISDLKINVEDRAEILLKFKSGAIVNIHMNYIQKVASRTNQLIGEKGIISWQNVAGKNEVNILTENLNEIKEFPPDDMLRTYEKEVLDFVNAIEKREYPAVGLEEGINTLKVVSAAKKSAKTGIKVKL